MATNRRPQPHTETEWFGIGGARFHISPGLLQVYAAEFLAFGKSAGPGPVFSAPRFYVMCHAIELALKAFLSLKKVPLSELAGRDYGHNLDKLLEEADNLDLHEMVGLSPEQREEIQRATKYYAEKVFEYPALGEAVVGYPGKPNLAILQQAAESLVASLEQPCRHYEPVVGTVEVTITPAADTSPSQRAPETPGPLPRQPADG